MDIKFSHHYPKLHGQSSAQLLKVKVCDRSELDEQFVIYDTMYEVKPAIGPFDEAVVDFYKLPSGRLLVLVFLGDKNIPFTTVRRWIDQKQRYYMNNIGQTFNIVHVAAEEKLSGAGTCA